MALTYGFYNSVEGDRAYDAIQFGQIFDGIITDGVYATFLKAMVVKASDNPSEVIVQPGRCWFNHTWTYIDADYPVTAPAPEVILDRVDALVLDINSENAFRENSLVWVQGTPSSINPERPTLIKSVTHNQYPLCYVYRKAGTTMIYAADITNAVGTSETPFVTGVLQGINIDDLLAQWDDEFHTWEASTKTSFEAWMVNQQSVYITWFNSIKDQMEDDLTSFEAWFETIRGIIDEEAATHLQAEIDDILDMLPAGSHIDISTNEPTLFNRNVTVSDGVHSKTVQFNAIGGATVESFPYIGIIDVSSTDGERIASESLNIPYFGRYSATLAFWSATVNLVGDETLAGLAVTVRDGNGDVVAIVTLNGSGSGVFTATKPDEYKFIYTYGGQTMEVSLAVTQETTYEVEIHGGLNYQAWLDAGRVSASFESLDDILEDEPTLRQLMLVHDSVDYLASAAINTDIEKIFNTDLAAKWINLSDYALDTFGAIPDIKAVMDEADKYGYGEWVITDNTTTPPTWGPKGNVPVMTGNSAPYGEASASTVESGYYAWSAFDGNTASWWVGQRGTTLSAQYLQYKFTNPICAKLLKVRLVQTDALPSTVFPNEITFKVYGSNDGSTWDSLKTITLSTAEMKELKAINIDSDSYYLYYKLADWSTFVYSVNNIQFVAVANLQFYGRELKVSVPTMTSDTAPYGEAFASSSYPSSGNYIYLPWRAFNGVEDNVDNNWASASNKNVGEYLGYDFKKKVIVKAIKIVQRTMRYMKQAKLQGSNDGTTWEDITSSITVGVGTTTPVFIPISNEEAFSQLRLICIELGGDESVHNVNVIALQFYGLDYSEKEFEVGTTKKWLYDHGVELEEMDRQLINGNTYWADSVMIKQDSSIMVIAKNASNAAGGVSNKTAINLTSFNLLRGKVNNFSQKIGMWVFTSGSTSSSLAEVQYTSGNGNLPNNIGIDVSSINSDVFTTIGVSGANSSGDFSELWLE